MSQKKKIVIFDDDKRQRQGWENELEKFVGAPRLDRMDSEKFLDTVRQLEKRQKRAREQFEQKEDIDFKGLDCYLDEVGILLVDYDLLDLDDSGFGSVLTGERLAYLARCYSRCDVIVAINQYGTRTFDLTLQGYPESFADLNVGAEHFADEGLWEAPPWKGFRPWSWPLLLQAEEAFAKRLRDLDEHMQTPIVDFLGLVDEEYRAVLPRNVVTFISTGRDAEAESVTFLDFVRHSGSGLETRDRTSDELEKRIAAARIFKWLESHVLAGQDILVDAPHLVLRFPSLLDGDLEKIEDWNRTAHLPEPEGVHLGKIAKHRFEKEHWLSRTAWHWDKIREDSSIPEVSDPWESPDPPGFVFCEDTSRFVEDSEAQEFVSSVPSSFVRRHVELLSEIEYRPSARLAL